RVHGFGEPIEAVVAIRRRVGHPVRDLGAIADRVIVIAHVLVGGVGLQRHPAAQVVPVGCFAALGQRCLRQVVAQVVLVGRRVAGGVADADQAVAGIIGARLRVPVLAALGQEIAHAVIG